MKHVFVIILISLSASVLSVSADLKSAATQAAATQAQGRQLSEKMAVYRDGCLKMLSAIEQRDKFCMYEAKELFGKVRLAVYADTISAVPQSDCHDVATVFFCTEYADSLLRHNFQFVPFDDVSQLREPDDEASVSADLKSTATLFCDDNAGKTCSRANRSYDFMVMHQAILPHKSLAYNSPGGGDCELMIVSTKPNSLRVTVKDLAGDKPISVVTGSDGLVSTASWHADSSAGAFSFTIENTTDGKVSFVVAVN